MPGHKTTAKKTSSKRMRSRSAKKPTPATRVLRYEVTNSGTPGNETSHYLDIAAGLSIVNRRLYRQGRDYHIKKITVVSSNTPNGENRVSFATTGQSWVSQMAWKRGFHTWQQMNADAQKQTSGDIAGTWSDFKVYLSNAMRGSTIELPLDNGGSAFLAGEWDYSELVSPNDTTSGDAFFLHFLGDHQGTQGSYSSVGLVKSYGESRATVNTGDPNVPNEASSDPLVTVFNYGETIEFIIADLEAQNDDPPYDLPSYPGDDLNGAKPQIMQDTTLVDGKATVGGFVARCGLIEIETKSPVANDVYSILVELAPGKYRGVKAEVI